MYLTKFLVWYAGKGHWALKLLQKYYCAKVSNTRTSSSVRHGSIRFFEKMVNMSFVNVFHFDV